MAIKPIARKVYRRVRGVVRPASNRLPVPPLSLMNAGRFLYQKRLFDRVKHLDGDIVECGVGMGATLLMWSELCYDEGQHRRIWGFDSFEGFPAPTVQDSSPRNPQKGEWAISTVRTIRDMLVTAGLSEEWVRSHVTLVKGFFDDSLGKYTGEKIALLHLDVDLYQSYKTALDTLYDRVQAGGVIAFDEYMGTFEHVDFPGAKQAIDEFFDGRRITLQRDRAFGKYYAVKPD